MFRVKKPNSEKETALYVCVVCVNKFVKASDTGAKFPTMAYNVSRMRSHVEKHLGETDISASLYKALGGEIRVSQALNKATRKSHKPSGSSKTQRQFCIEKGKRLKLENALAYAFIAVNAPFSNMGRPEVRHLLDVASTNWIPGSELQDYRTIRKHAFMKLAAEVEASRKDLLDSPDTFLTFMTDGYSPHSHTEEHVWCIYFSGVSQSLEREAVSWAWATGYQLYHPERL